jgi:hypothetical protein
VDNYMDRERPVKEGDMPEHRPNNDRAQLAALGEATRRNCWTCRYDSIEEDTGSHLCHALAGLGVVDWVEDHVAGNGDVESMPAHDAPPCPGWEAKDEQATVQDSLMVRPGGWRGNLPLCRGPGGTMARRMAALVRRTR